MPGTANSGGRNKKSTAAHRLTKTFRSDRHHDASPEPPVGTPDPPTDLTDEALNEWQRMVARLTMSRTLTLADDAALVNYCRLHADATRLQHALDAVEPFYEKVSVDGAGVEHVEPKVHPGFAQLRAYRQALRMFLQEFGLTPVARSRVRVGDVDEPDALGQFLDSVH